MNYTLQKATSEHLDIVLHWLKDEERETGEIGFRGNFEINHVAKESSPVTRTPPNGCYCQV